MKKKARKKNRKKLRKIRRKLRRFKKLRKIKTKKRRKISRKIKRRKISKKRKTKVRLKTTISSLSKIKIPIFKEQRKQLKKLNFQSMLNFVLRPFFMAYDDFREKRRIKRLRKIALEKKRKRKTNKRRASLKV